MSEHAQQAVVGAELRAVGGDGAAEGVGAVGVGAVGVGGIDVGGDGADLADAERAASDGERAAGPGVEDLDEIGGLPVEERVRRRVGALDRIADRPLSEHAQRYDEVHAELQAALTEIDGESG